MIGDLIVIGCVLTLVAAAVRAVIDERRSRREFGDAKRESLPPHRMRKQ